MSEAERVTLSTVTLSAQWTISWSQRKEWSEREREKTVAAMTVAHQLLQASLFHQQPPLVEGKLCLCCPSCLPYWICHHVNCYCLNQLIEMELFSESSIRPSFIMKCLWRAQLVNGVVQLGDSAANNSVLGRRDSNSRSRCHLILKRRIGSCGPDITCLRRHGLIEKDSHWLYSSLCRFSFAS